MASYVPIGSGPPIDDEEDEFDYFDGCKFVCCRFFPVDSQTSIALKNQQKSITFSNC